VDGTHKNQNASVAEPIGDEGGTGFNWGQMSSKLGQEQHRVAKYEQAEQSMLDLARVPEQNIKGKVAQ
jgi:hypothetical protein